MIDVESKETYEEHRLRFDLELLRNSLAWKIALQKDRKKDRDRIFGNKKEFTGCNHEESLRLFNAFIDEDEEKIQALEKEIEDKERELEFLMVKKQRYQSFDISKISGLRK